MARPVTSIRLAVCFRIHIIVFHHVKGRGTELSLLGLPVLRLLEELM